MKPTREEVIRVARELALYLDGENTQSPFWVLTHEELERLAQHFYEAGSAAAREPLQKDAERYRWLKENCALGIKQNGVGWSLNTRQCAAPDRLKDVDATIDAAIKENKT